MPDQPVVAQLYPCLVETEAGRTYLWCRCGRSARQPFCDGAHKGTGIEPLAYTASRSGPVHFCCCKQTGDAPFCDGSHNGL